VAFVFSSWISIQGGKWEQTVKRCLILFLIVPVLAEMELLFFIAAHTALFCICDQNSVDNTGIFGYHFLREVLIFSKSAYLNLFVLL